MQILSNALPGFRDLRGPVIAGYMWLLFVWLVFKPDTDERPTNAVGAALYDLAQDLGQWWVLVAASVAAYLVGSLSLAASSWITATLQRGILLSEIVGGRRVRRDRYGSMRSALPNHIDAKLSAKGAGISHEPGDVQGELQSLLEHRVQSAVFSIEAEKRLPATLLVAGQPELFAEVDRLRAEGELRLAVALPLVALSILAGVEVSPWWLLALLGAVALWIQGAVRLAESQGLIGNAIALNKIESPSVQGLNDWLDQFPENVREQIEGFRAAS